MAKRKNHAARDGRDRDSEEIGSSNTQSGYFAYEGLNRVLHEKARLGILTALRTRTDGLVFAELKALCSLTDGNLSRHLTVLQDAGFVTIKKGQSGNRPQTWARLTSRGKKEFDAYLEELQRVIQDASIRIAPTTRTTPGEDAPSGVAPA